MRRHTLRASTETVSILSIRAQTLPPLLSGFSSYWPNLRKDGISLLNELDFSLGRYGLPQAVEKGVKVKHERVDFCSFIHRGFENEVSFELELSNGDLPKDKVLRSMLVARRKGRRRAIINRPSRRMDHLPKSRGRQHLQSPHRIDL